MSDTQTQLCVEFERAVKVETAHVTAMLVLADKKVITVDTDKQINLYDEGFNQIHQMQFTVSCWWGISDMAQTGPRTFSVLVPGYWYGSWLVSFEVTDETEEESKIKETSKIEVDSKAFGLCWQKDFFFVTFSPRSLFQISKSPPGYVCMMSKNGKIRHTFKTDQGNKTLFSSLISKVYVDENFKMFVCDKVKKEIVILKIDPFSYAATVITRHRYSVKDIATKIDGTCFLATSHADGVVLLHANGRWIFNNFLSSNRLHGSPIALAYNEENNQLTMAVLHSQWFPTVKTWLVFKIYTVNYSQDSDVHVSIED